MVRKARTYSEVNFLRQQAVRRMDVIKIPKAKLKKWLNESIDFKAFEVARMQDKKHRLMMDILAKKLGVKTRREGRGM